MCLELNPNPSVFMDIQPSQPSEHRHRSHRGRKRARSPRRIWILRGLGVLVLTSIFVALWYWNRSFSRRTTFPLEDSSVSRPE